MKQILLPIFCLSLLLLPSCEKKTPVEKTVDKVENKVKDATDSRPGEPIRDAAEDARDAIKK
jgi:hypothetical protein